MLRGLAAQGFLGLLAGGDVADGAGDQPAFRRFQRSKADFDRELRAVFAQSEEFQPRAHGADLRVGEELRAMAGML